MANDNKTNFVPYVPASKKIPEVTPQAVVLGVLLGIVLAAANVYLGLYAGMTVSASIPAAVISMGVLRGILRRGTILENNIVQTIAASGESLAAGVIFTVPAMLIAGVWTEIQFWPTTLICICGGLLGIVFMIPLRKSHIVEDKTLTFPEGVACAEVLKAGETGGSGAKYVLISIALGSAFKFLSAGLTLLKGSVEWAWMAGKTAFFFGADVSAALIGVGHIVGLNVACLSFLGGIIAWGIAIPWLGLSHGVEGEAMEWFWKTWSTKIRYLGVGAMIVGGVWSIINQRRSLLKGFQEAVLGYKGGQGTAILRTEVNMKQSHLVLILIGTTLTVLMLYLRLVGSMPVALVATLSMVVMSFFFVAVASYIVGLVGSSNSPVSGMTICAVLVTGALLTVFGMTGQQAIIATLGVAGVVCCAAASAGDISQDLKTGYLLGSTPKNQQWMEVLGAAVPAFVMGPVLVVLHTAYGIGTGNPGSLKAPQATLFANLTKGMFGEGSIPWNLVFVGMLIGVVIVTLDQIQKSRNASFRFPVMAVAVGTYLPLTLSTPIFLGGLTTLFAKNKSEAGVGVLFSSGLIAGEAIMGVVVGAVIYFKKDALPINIGEPTEWLSTIALLGLVALLMVLGKRKAL